MADNKLPTLEEMYATGSATAPQAAPIPPQGQPVQQDNVVSVPSFTIPTAAPAPIAAPTPTPTPTPAAAASQAGLTLPEYLRKINELKGQEAWSNADETDRTAKEAEDQAAFLQQSADEQKNSLHGMNAQHAQNMAQTVADQNTYRQALSDFDAHKLENPSAHFWNSKDTAGKLSAAIGIGLGGLGAAVGGVGFGTPQENKVLQRIDGLIKDDYRTQLDNKENSWKNVQALGEQRKYDIDKDTHDTTHFLTYNGLALQHVDNQLKAMIAATKSPEIKHNGEVLLQGVQSQILQNQRAIGQYGEQMAAAAAARAQAARKEQFERDKTVADWEAKYAADHPTATNNEFEAAKERAWGASATTRGQQILAQAKRAADIANGGKPASDAQVQQMARALNEHHNYDPNAPAFAGAKPDEAQVKYQVGLKEMTPALESLEVKAKNGTLTSTDTKEFATKYGQYISPNTTWQWMFGGGDSASAIKEIESIRAALNGQSNGGTPIVSGIKGKPPVKDTSLVRK
jgi:hypothetical protein